MLIRLLALTVFTVMPLVASAQGMVERFQSGTHYFPIVPAQPGKVDGRIEVVEAFGYACGACASFEPHAREWRKHKPANVQFTLLPVQFNPTWEMFARAYYAAAALGIAEQGHQALFDAVQVKRSVRTLADAAKVYAQYGKTAEQFLAATNSFGVGAKLKQAKLMVPRYQVEGTPTLIVAGKYRITTKSAGSYAQMFVVADFLIAKETAAMAQPAAAAG
ncbi:MAG: thiol:disulfide interchange protein DsbA/DsbL [Rhodanobacteraceae bacterium]|nr:thiol:disulfide interchange protein DsbA/DsbL [Rhodanobacteraceae bacterium]MBK7043788.1 thiol:disulfide interchange protein DsbA/DsbL [Rhodanobacteraceae bacterium]MBP9155591.1 thiol:disulfide interchange protein DsbA/DsbL [Xanthomonadales bacterium]HQW80469.1 thiol:disulfide interchange protein DsbA/DsbL [Pseudomonadota bacterium]